MTNQDSDYAWENWDDYDSWAQEMYENEQYAQDGFLDNPDYMTEEIWHDEQ